MYVYVAINREPYRKLVSAKLYLYYCCTFNAMGPSPSTQGNREKT
jgi:hypothetical protein